MSLVGVSCQHVEEILEQVLDPIMKLEPCLTLLDATHFSPSV